MLLKKELDSITGCLKITCKLWSTGRKEKGGNPSGLSVKWDAASQAVVCHFLLCIFALLMWVSAALSTSCTPTLVKSFLVVNLYLAPCEHFVVCMCGTVVILWVRKATVNYRNRFSGLRFDSVLPFRLFHFIFFSFVLKEGLDAAYYGNWECLQWLHDAD